MTQKRDLHPMTVYLPEKARTDAEHRASAKGLATGTFLRLVLLGHEKPLKS